MVKITFPDIDIREAIELVESVYGVMYWNHEKGRCMAYPLGVENPVIVEQSPNQEFKKG